MIQKKICLLGASGVGKTSLVKQFVEGMFTERYLTTIGVKVDKKVVDLGIQEVQLMIWDIEGMEIHKMAREVTDVPAILIINKSDLDVAWHWSKNEINGFSKEFINCFNTSAKTGEQVEPMFQFVAQVCSAKP